MKRYARSLRRWKEYCRFVIPGSATISKEPHIYTFGAYPIFIASGKGSTLVDVDGNAYIDYQGALGATILGVSYPRVNAAIRAQLEKGTLFSYSQDLQIGLAKRICAAVPSAERVRFVKNGSDATSAAVRIARAFTGRSVIASCHFHGWHDWFYVSTNLKRGIPEACAKGIVTFPYNDLLALEKVFREHPGEIAAVILEPVHLEPPKQGYLRALKALVHKHGALLIFDEVVTGFRFSLGGAQALYHVTPDLTTLAKALGNGTSIAAVAGKRRIMDATADVITSMTYAEETLPMAAAIATIDELKRKPVHAHIWRLGERFQRGYNALAQRSGIPTKCIGLPPRLELTFADHRGTSRRHLKAFFLQETAREGVLFGIHIFMTYAHTQRQIDETLRLCARVFARIAKHGSRPLPLEGELPRELW